MASDIIPLMSILELHEYREIDVFCAQHPGTGALPEMAGFLAERFNISLATDPAVVEGFIRDSSNLKGRATGLARPRDTRECAILLRACFSAHVPVTVSGGKSNLTGSATPEDGMVLSTVRMLTPEPRVDTETRRVTAPVGMILEDLRRWVLQHTDGRLRFPVDPTSRSDASVGGCLACNASGFTPGDTGAMRAWVQSLYILLPNGMAIEADRGRYRSKSGGFRLQADNDKPVLWPVPTHPRPPIKNAGGPFSAPDGCMDIVDLLVGSEGLFGLVTACTLVLADQPDDYLDLFISLPEESDALRLLETTVSHRGGDWSGLTAFEYFGVNCRRYMNHQDRFFQAGGKVGVYIQEPLFNRSPEDAAEDWLDVLNCAKLDLPDEAILLMDTEALRAVFMDARHSMPANALEVVQRRGTFTIMTDTVVPPATFREFLAFTHKRLQTDGLEYLVFGHLGDCHLHFTLLPETSQVEVGVAAYDEIVATCSRLGGIYSGEHGTGKRKRKDFLRCHGAKAADGVLRCKQAIDPFLLLNRGNVINGELEK